MRTIASHCMEEHTHALSLAVLGTCIICGTRVRVVGPGGSWSVRGQYKRQTLHTLSTPGAYLELAVLGGGVQRVTESNLGVEWEHSRR